MLPPSTDRFTPSKTPATTKHKPLHTIQDTMPQLSTDYFTPPYTLCYHQAQTGSRYTKPYATVKQPLSHLLPSTIYVQANDLGALLCDYSAKKK